MLTKDESWMAMAFIAAQRSRCDRSQTGCVIVSAQNRIVATGYNGPPANHREISDGSCVNWCARAATGGLGSENGYLTCPSIHAEANALIYASRRDIEGGTMYVTRIPCWDCAKLIGNSGIARIMCVCDDPADNDRDTGAAYKMMADSGLWVDYGRTSELRLVK